MAAMLMQPPAHRPSMDHVGSFESSRNGATSGGYDRHSPAPGQSRPSGPSAPTQSTQQQPGVGFVQPTMTGGFFPNNMPGFPVQGAWGATPLPASSFYAPPFAFPAGFQQQGFQHQQQDFSAWAHVYQQMVANGHMAPPGGHNMPRPAQFQDAEESDAHRRRTVSGTSSNNNDPRVTKGQPPAANGNNNDPVFHPYKRGPKSRSASGTSRSGSQSISLSELPKPTAPPRGPSPGEREHRRTGSVDSSILVNGNNGEREEELIPPPKLRGSRDEQRPASVKSERSNRSQGSAGSSASQGARTGKQGQGAAPERPQHGRTASSTSASNKSTPLTTGSISTQASNSQQAPAPAQTRNSPLSQTPQTPAPPQTVEKTEKAEKKSGFRGRFKNASDKDQKTSAAPATRVQSPTPARSLTPAAAAANKSQPGPSSTKQDLAPPNAPFVNTQAMTSDLSLAETERTAATNASVKPRRGLFRNRNRSSDNISLSSTVSSASMMIRKMGSLGKLARRNSLMGISKIFKEKPKDEDGALPEKQGILSFKKKSGKKADLAPVSVSRTTAELDRGSEDDDRILAGLSPAAQLARQHTARSKAEAAKREAARRSSPETIQELSGPTGEPTWDQNTTTARGQLSTGAPNGQGSGPNVVHVVPRSPTVVHALAINGQEDASDISDTDTIDDVTASMNRSHLQDPDEEDFQPLWCKAHIDKHAKPKRGILKQVLSNEELEGSQRLRTASSSALDASSPGPLSDLPAPNPERIDGIPHAHHVDSPSEMVYDPLSPTFSPFENNGLDLDLRPPVYKNPAHNTSAPTLSPAGPVAPTQARAMTAPTRRRLVWAPECAVYSTYDAVTYDRRSEPATCNRLTPELAMSIKQELNAFKLEMPVHPSSRVYTHYFA